MYSSSSSVNCYTLLLVFRYQKQISTSLQAYFIQSHYFKVRIQMFNYSDVGKINLILCMFHQYEQDSKNMQHVTHWCLYGHFFFTPGPYQSFWIGGREANPALEDGNWVWDMSGISVNHTLWHTGQPDNHNGAQDYVCILIGESGLNDGTGSTARTFLCETASCAVL